MWYRAVLLTSGLALYVNISANFWPIVLTVHFQRDIDFYGYVTCVAFVCFGLGHWGILVTKSLFFLWHICQTVCLLSASLSGMGSIVGSRITVALGLTSDLFRRFVFGKH